jgi:hypothetical protein
MIKEIFKMEKTYYLIDFENVGSDGLKGCDQLKKNDQIHLFYTNNANKISLDVFSRRGEAELYVHKVPVKSQSLDMHLVSYLGYLLGINEESCSYVIISKDTDFDNIIKFWQEEKDAKISRLGRIVPEKKSEKKAKKKLTDMLVKKPEPAPAAAPSARTELNNNLQKALSAAGKSGEVIAYVTSVAMKHAGKNNGKQTVYRTMVAEYGQDQGRDIYNRIRKYI